MAQDHSQSNQINQINQGSPIKMTAYSHGAGCGCKISPSVLSTIVQSNLQIPPDGNLLVGNGSMDDAAAYDIGGGQAILSTTDFFMPVVDDPFDFGRIAATNAISDIYAMGGLPLMAIAILGWPVGTLPAEVAQQVVDGGRQACMEAGIQLAGGHSIDAPEPIFGLAVTGQVAIKNLKQNNTAQPGDWLYLTKPLGIGVLTTAEKQNIVQQQHQNMARDLMCALNTIGPALAQLDGVHAITDVTGFGLLGHLCELCDGSDVSAILDSGRVPVLPPVNDYLDQGAVPGGTGRNFDSYGHKIGSLSAREQEILCDPQTSGGLLVAVSDQARESVESLLAAKGLPAQPIGHLIPRNTGGLSVIVDSLEDFIHA